VLRFSTFGFFFEPLGTCVRGWAPPRSTGLKRSGPWSRCGGVPCRLPVFGSPSVASVLSAVDGARDLLVFRVSQDSLGPSPVFLFNRRLEPLLLTRFLFL